MTKVEALKKRVDALLGNSKPKIIWWYEDMEGEPIADEDRQIRDYAMENNIPYVIYPPGCKLDLEEFFCEDYGYPCWTNAYTHDLFEKRRN